VRERSCAECRKRKCAARFGEHFFFALVRHAPQKWGLFSPAITGSAGGVNCRQRRLPLRCCFCSFGWRRRLDYGLWGFDRHEMKIHIDASALRRTHWSEYGMRFLFGGAITAAAAVIADKFGPQVGGLFLAFPSIFPASATLIEKHERQKKGRKGLHGTLRRPDSGGGRGAGAAMGTVGLIVFAVLVWRLCRCFQVGWCFV
jgi:hypothetical protein